MTEPPITVLIADDQDLVRTGFTLVVHSAADLRVVATAATGAEAVDLAAAHQPDVILMDIRMPHTDGTTATRAILAALGPRPKIIALTTYDSDDYATRILIDDFTARERDVFHLVVAGASNAEIAQRLHLAEVTVKTHVGRVLAKLGVRDRVNIVIWAYRNGVVG